MSSSGLAVDGWAVTPRVGKKPLSREGGTKPGVEPLRFHSVDPNSQLEDQEVDFENGNCSGYRNLGRILFFETRGHTRN